ncbi:MAG: hypothetical protein Q4F67_17470 [Propionibacteriaceae bacterium]|nr:hypothetical protein [Propionibacteriaceae bacterium]
MSASVRSIHRWVSLAFLVTMVMAVAAGFGLPEWLFYLPLAPLALLVLTGIYLNIRAFRASRSVSAEVIVRRRGLRGAG